ncbi:MAG: hypothetical protein ACE5FY_04110 [Nitrospiria bacterium]
MSQIGKISRNIDIEQKNKENVPLSAPPRIERNDLIKAHGQTGWLILRLQRYALLGWGLFFVLFFILLGSYFLNMVLPKSVMVVDNEGQYIGDVDFFEPVKRHDDELISAGKRFLSFYLSMNSETIFEDYAIAMNMMEKSLLDQTKENIKKDGYLARISKAGSRSHIEYKLGEDGTRLIERKALESSSRYKGVLTIFPLEGPPVESPFNITLFMKAVPSTSLRKSGIEITAIHDN